MSTGASQITSAYDYLSKRLFRWIHRWPVNSPHKGPITRKMFPLDDVIKFYLSNHDLVIHPSNHLFGPLLCIYTFSLLVWFKEHFYSYLSLLAPGYFTIFLWPVSKLSLRNRWYCLEGNFLTFFSVQHRTCWWQNRDEVPQTRLVIPTYVHLCGFVNAIAA